jgi:hypothetical protein
LTADPSKNENPATNKQNRRNPKIRAFCNYIVRSIIGIIGFLKSIDSLIVAMATVFLAFIAYWQWEALEKTDYTLRQTLVAANRAWIAPIQLRLESPVVAVEPISVALVYRNVGKEPALNMTAKLFIGGADLPPNGIWEKLVVPPGDLCERAAEAVTISSVAYPLENDYLLHTKIRIAEEYASAKRIALVAGCIRYETFKLAAQSAYCFYLSPDDLTNAKNWSFMLCLTGNSAK